jgi:hypothetical protein
MFELFSDIYFVVYKLYYVGQNDNLGIHVSLKKWDRGSSLAKIQQLSLSSINRVPHKHFAYDTVLRNLHCERPKAHLN